MVQFGFHFVILCLACFFQMASPAMLFFIKLQWSDDSVALMVSVFSCWCKTCNNAVIEESNKLGILSEMAACWLFPITKVDLPA